MIIAGLKPRLPLKTAIIKYINYIISYDHIIKEGIARFWQDI